MSILDQIVEVTRASLANRKQKLPVGELERSDNFGRDRLDFASALRGDELAFISEVKKASPSKGVIRPDFRPVDFARSYEEGGAVAISVLTEPEFFQGSLDDLAAVRNSVSVPLLRKDFILDVYQLFEARAHGADAVLLIAAVLDRIHLRDLYQAARELGLAALVEVYEFHELDRIDFDEIEILGVNNRNLRTFEVDAEHSLRVFAEVPDGILKVSESGLHSAEQLVHLNRHGVDAVLIGETFMRADDPGAALMRLREEMNELAEG